MKMNTINASTLEQMLVALELTLMALETMEYRDEKSAKTAGRAITSIKFALDAYAAEGRDYRIEIREAA